MISAKRPSSCRPIALHSPDGAPPALARPASRGPSLPAPLALPLRLVPDRVVSQLAVTVLNRALAQALREGELDFLRGRSVTIRVRDAGLAMHLGLDRRGRLVARRYPAGDLLIEASVYDFLVLVGQQEDPDTLVFQRRLVMQGDTELGLEVKNFLDGLDVEALGLYRQLAPLLRRLLPVYRRAFS